MRNYRLAVESVIYAQIVSGVIATTPKFELLLTAGISHLKIGNGDAGIPIIMLKSLCVARRASNLMRSAEMD